MLNKRQSVSEMKHYTIEEFCADADAIMESVSRENTAYILETPQDQYVLCPASWVFPVFEREANYLAPYTVRYALDQNPETAELVCADIRRRMSAFSYGTIEKMIDDITAYLIVNKRPETAPVWEQLCEDLKEELKRTDTEEVVLTFDEEFAAQIKEYTRLRGITFQQLAETMFERIVRDNPELRKPFPAGANGSTPSEGSGVIEPSDQISQERQRGDG